MTIAEICAARDRAMSSFDFLMASAHGRGRYAIANDRAAVARDFAECLSVHFPTGVVSKLESQYRRGLITREELRVRRWRLSRRYCTGTPVSLVK